MKIFIAAAHGGGDPGAVANNTNEATECIKLVDEVVATLHPITPPGKTIYKVPHELSGGLGVTYINKNSVTPHEDICIEINMNSNQGTPGTGIETYYGYKPLAEVLQKNMVATLKLADRGVKWGDNYYFNKETRPMSALVEVGFINNINDLKVVREKGALAIAKGVADYIGLGLPTVPPPPLTRTDYQMVYTKARQVVREARNNLQAFIDKYPE